MGYVPRELTTELVPQLKGEDSESEGYAEFARNLIMGRFRRLLRMRPAPNVAPELKRHKLGLEVLRDWVRLPDSTPVYRSMPGIPLAVGHLGQTAAMAVLTERGISSSISAISENRRRPVISNGERMFQHENTTNQWQRLSMVAADALDRVARLTKEARETTGAQPSLAARDARFIFAMQREAAIVFIPDAVLPARDQRSLIFYAAMRAQGHLPIATTQALEEAELNIDEFLAPQPPEGSTSARLAS